MACTKFSQLQILYISSLFTSKLIQTCPHNYVIYGGLVLFVSALSFLTPTQHLQPKDYIILLLGGFI